jgi:hypothetical protein
VEAVVVAGCAEAMEAIASISAASNVKTDLCMRLVSPDPTIPSYTPAAGALSDQAAAAAGGGEKIRRERDCAM